MDKSSILRISEGTNGLNNYEAALESQIVPKPRNFKIKKTYLKSLCAQVSYLSPATPQIRPGLGTIAGVR